METLAEFLVAFYLTRGGKVFIAPQYSIPSESPNADWSCPDFVALDFGKREVVLVEVISGANLSPIIAKIRNRQAQWYDRLRTKLTNDKVITSAWGMRFLGFVRRHNLEKAKATCSGERDVTFFAIEDATFDWEYWTSRASGLPE